jgi:hypothetical protein
MLNFLQQKWLLINSFHEILLEPTDIFPNRWPESTGQLSWNTVKTNPRNAAFTLSTAKQAVEAENEAAMVAEVDTAAGDGTARAAGVLVAPVSTVLILLIPTGVSQAVNGRP